MGTAFVENKFIILFSILIFIIPMFIGYIFAHYISELLNPMVDSFRDRVQNGDIKIAFDSIFLNNIKVGIIMYGGAVVFGLLTALLLISNGVFIGYFATQMPLNAFLLYTLPHGIFEIPAVILAGASGFILFKFIVSFIFNIFSSKINENHNNFDNLTLKDKIVYSLNFNINKLTQSISLFGLSFVLFIIAAVVEAYLTIPIASFFI